MKTMLIVSLAVAAALVSTQGAAAGSVSRDRSDYRALATNPNFGGAAPAHLPGASECGTDRASPIWGANGQSLGNECLGNANGS